MLYMQRRRPPGRRLLPPTAGADVTRHSQRKTLTGHLSESGFKHQMQGLQSAETMNRLPSLITAALVVLLVPLTPHAEDLAREFTGSYINDGNHTRFLWKIRHLGLSNYTARINEVTMSLSLDASNLENSSIDVHIDPRKVDTGFIGDKDFNGEIYADERILNASQFPSISFVSRSIEDLDNGNLIIRGDLTLLGVSLPVVMNAALTGSTLDHPFMNVPALGFHATGTIDRTDFGLDFLSGSALGDEIEIDVQAEFIKQ